MWNPYLRYPDLQNSQSFDPNSPYYPSLLQGPQARYEHNRNALGHNVSENPHYWSQAGAGEYSYASGYRHVHSDSPANLGFSDEPSMGGFGPAAKVVYTAPPNSLNPEAAEFTPTAFLSSPQKSLSRTSTITSARDTTLENQEKKSILLTNNQVDLSVALPKKTSPDLKSPVSYKDMLQKQVPQLNPPQPTAAPVNTSLASKESAYNTCSYKSAVLKASSLQQQSQQLKSPLRVTTHTAPVNASLNGTQVICRNSQIFREQGIDPNDLLNNKNFWKSCILLETDPTENG